MTLQNPFRLAILVPLLFAAGCYINVHNNDGDGHNGGPLPTDPPDYSCQDNSECQTGEYCFRSECRAIPAGAQACTTSSQCGHREFCINGYCTELCAKNSDCTSAGTVCEDNYCVTPPSGTDAGSGGTTDGGSSGNASCVQHADCGVGAYCINTVCYLGCQTDLDCPAAEACQAGVCHTRPPQEQPACTTGAQCATGEDCVDGACSAPCTSNTACPSGQSCVIGYCTVTPPPSGSGSACTANCECPSGETCKNGMCQL